ncbi:MAG: NUDIX domain-containing protein [Eubacterium sp.]|nr:NUDIX domain-containing protein [Eubacterium sp.]
MDNYIKSLRQKVGHDRLILCYAGCIITDDKGRFLLQKRTDCNKWGFLGGMLELGESAQEAAVREIKEESGLDVEITSLYGIYSKYFDEYANGDKMQSVCIIFKAKVTGGELISGNSETAELKYFYLDDIPTLFNKQHQDILADIKANKEYVYR